MASTLLHREQHVNSQQIKYRLNSGNNGFRGATEKVNILFLLLASAQIMLISSGVLAQLDDMSLDGLSLSLSSAPPSSSSTSSLSSSFLDLNEPTQAEDSGTILHQITTDDFSGEFKLTELALEFVGNSLEKFAIVEQLDPAKVAEGNLISSWLFKLSNGRPLTRNPLIEKTVADLDYIYASYFSKFSKLIETIITERPPEINLGNLGFRCERRAELVNLQELAQTSGIFRIILDIFFSELYTHCLKRKFAIIKLSNVKPSSVLRQFVDIYMDIPTQYALNRQSSDASLNDAELRALNEVKTSIALNFNLQKSLERHGPMQLAAQLVFDGKSALSIGAAQLDVDSLIHKFLRDCQEHVGQLGQVWGQFDLVASFLSSSMNDLAAFNEKIKTVAPQLLYGSICSQLAQTVKV